MFNLLSDNFLIQNIIVNIYMKLYFVLCVAFSLHFLEKFIQFEDKQMKRGLS